MHVRASAQANKEMVGGVTHVPAWNRGRRQQPGFLSVPHLPLHVAVPYLTLLPARVGDRAGGVLAEAAGLVCRDRKFQSQVW